MKNKVACIYLTYDHPAVMDEVLDKICGTYGSKGIDIYVYDSSENDDTRHIVESYIAKGLCRLFYVSVPFIKGGDEKYLYAIRGNGLEGEYDYIWPTKDRCFFTGETLDKICEAMDDDHDIVFAVDERDRYEIITRPLKDAYTDPSEFFADYGALTTNWECLIRRVDTMLAPIDWELYENRYKVGNDNNFNQTLTTFARLAEMNKCSIRVIESGPDDKRYSDKAEPMWINSLFNVWIDKWIPAVYSLPECYDAYKMPVIKTQLGHVSLFGSNDSLVFMRDMKVLTPERVGLLSSMWDMISRIPYGDLEKILAGNEKEVFEDNYKSFVESFTDHDYEKGYYLFIRNRWFADRIPQDKYRILSLSYYIYMKEMRKYGTSALFDGIDDISGLCDRFRQLSST